MCVNKVWYTAEQYVVLHESYVKCGFGWSQFCHKFPGTRVPSTTHTHEHTNKLSPLGHFWTAQLLNDTVHWTKENCIKYRNHQRAFSDSYRSFVWWQNNMPWNYAHLNQPHIIFNSNVVWKNKSATWTPIQKKYEKTHEEKF